jgi:hypothetical protein
LIDRLVIERLPVNVIDTARGIFAIAVLVLALRMMYGGQGSIAGKPRPLTKTSRQEPPDPHQYREDGHRSGIFAIAGVSHVAVWIVVLVLVPVATEAGRSAVGVIRAGVMCAGIVTATAILFAGRGSLWGRGQRSLLHLRRWVLVLMIATMASWWIAPILLLFVSAALRANVTYLEIVFPITYVFPVVAALAIRRVSGSW